MYTTKHRLYTWHFLYSPLLPFDPLSTYLEPSFCDRIRPPRSQVARKLTPLFPHLAHVPSHPKSRPPLGFPDPNMYLIRTTLRTQPISSRTLKVLKENNIFNLCSNFNAISAIKDYLHCFIIMTVYQFYLEVVLFHSELSEFFSHKLFPTSRKEYFHRLKHSG
jgi:hypothetical protein